MNVLAELTSFAAYLACGAATGMALSLVRALSHKVISGACAFVILVLAWCGCWLITERTAGGVVTFYGATAVCLGAGAAVMIACRVLSKRRLLKPAPPARKEKKVGRKSEKTS